MFRKLNIVLILVIIVFVFSSCSSKVNDSSDKSTLSKNAQTKVHVVVSFYAIEEFARAIGKDKVEITTMIPSGTEPHDFEPKARDIEELSNADVFVYNGLGMETWVDKALEIVGDGRLIVVNASKGCSPLRSDELSNEGNYDPHLWVSLKGAEIEAKNIMEALIKADSKNTSYYEKNYAEFYNSLERLVNEYSEKFKRLPNRNFVTGHAAFAYLCRDFGLKQNSVEGVFAEGEPSAKKLKGLIDYCKNNKIKTVFVEDMVSPRVSETLAEAVGANTVKIYTAESKENNKTYLQCMVDNMKNIYASLEAKGK